MSMLNGDDTELLSKEDADVFGCSDPHLALNDTEDPSDPHSNDDSSTNVGAGGVAQLVPRTSSSAHDQKSGLLVVAASCVAAVGGVLFGYDTGIVSGALLQLQTEFSLSCLQRELVVSSLLLGALCASVTGGFLVDYFGRRVVIIVNGGVFIAGSLVLALANSFPVIIAGRLILGYAVSLSATAECVYISEISPPSKRGMLVSLNELGITVGFLLAYLINYTFISANNGWRFMFGLSVVPALGQMLGMLPLPASPRFLMIQLKDHQARAVLCRLRGRSDVDAELSAIRRAITEQQNSRVCELCSSNKNMRTRFVLAMVLVTLQQVTGQPNVLFYAPTVFQAIGFQSNTAATMATVGLGVVKVVFTLVTLLTIDKIGRRVLLITGVSIMTVSIITMGLISLTWPQDEVHDVCRSHPSLNTSHYINHTYTEDFPFDPRVPITVVNSSLQDTSFNRDKRSVMEHVSLGRYNASRSLYNASASHEGKWPAMVALMLYVAGYAISFGPGTWLVLSELFPSSLRGRAISMATVFNWGANIVMSMTFLNIMSVMGVPTTFLGYGAMCAASVAFIYFCIPETKGRSLEQLSHELNESTGKGLCCCPPPQQNIQCGRRYHRVVNDDNL